MTQTIAQERCVSNDILANYLSERQFAKLINRDLRTVRRWHAKRIGPPRIVFQKLVLYRREAIEKWLLSHETAPVANRRRR